MSQTQTRSVAQLAWSAWSVTTPATCEAAGSQTRTCPGNASPAQTQPIAQLAWDPATQFCQAGTNVVKSLCGTSTYTATQFCDSRDGKPYKFVTIGTQTWMAENLNYNANGSKCYNNQDSYCTQYGRLYDWATAMALPNCGYGTSCASQIGAKHRGICPSGWHIPSTAEWTTLENYIGDDYTAGTKLKAMSGWNNNGNGTDNYGFAALPGGDGSNGNFTYVGETGYWWSANEAEIYSAYRKYMYSNSSYVFSNNIQKSVLQSVRCVQD